MVWKIVGTSEKCPWYNTFVGCLHGRKNYRDKTVECSEEHCPIKVATMCQDCKAGE
jgi:hypothetical protein